MFHGKTRNNNSVTKKTILYSSWKQTTIRRIIQNEVYLGTLVQHKRRNINYKSKKRVNVPKEERIYCYNTHEAIIDKETFDKANQILSKNKAWKMSNKHDYLFKGLLYCKECGARLNVTFSHYALKKYGEYRYTTICYSYSRLYSDICTRHSNKMSDLENVLLKHIRSVCNKYINRDFQNELIIAANNELSLDSNNSLEKELKNIKTKIKEYDKYIENLYMDKVNGVIDTEQFLNLTVSFKSQKASYEQKIKELQGNILNQKSQEETEKEIKKIVENFLKMKRPTKELLFSLIDKIYISENHEIEIHYKFKELNEI